MNIILDEKVKERLTMMRRNAITIYTAVIGSCWSPRPDVFVRLNEPSAHDKYNIFEVEDIKVYLYKEAELTGDTLRIEPAKHVSDLADKEFDVYGLKID